MNSKLRKIRIALGFNSKEFVERLSEFCTITYRAYTSYEAGEHKLQPELLKILCEQYNVNLNWLVANKGEMFLSENKAETKAISREDIALEVEKILKEKGVVL